MLTPFTETGLKQFDSESPMAAVVLAWTVPGPHPSWHEACKQSVRNTMPVLARALDRMAAMTPWD